MLNDFIISNNFNMYTYIAIVIAVILLGTSIVVAISHYFSKYILITCIDKLFNENRAGWRKIIYQNHLVHRLAYLVPALIIYHFSYLFDFDYSHFKLFLSEIIQSLTIIYLMIGTAFVISAIFNCINDRYNQLSIAKLKPIKSYFQVAKIILFFFTIILIASFTLNKSPAYFFASVGAATAFLAIIFKDPIMGFIASIQLGAYDMVRIGDWIEMANFGADGEVIDISLNTVKVQNFDMTIVTIPSYALLTSGLKNWRGMEEAGGRRVKRSINIDINSIKICDQSFLENIEKQHDLSHYKKLLKSDQLTNLGIFRFYLEEYLRQHPEVHQDMSILIRQLQPTPTGLPIELYFFTRDTTSKKYEAIQADIIEHVYAMMPQFNLRAFQYNTSAY